MRIEITAAPSRFLLGLLLTLSLSPLLKAQQRSLNSVAVQREAMQKLAFLIGHWSGPLTITRGPGEVLKLTQTENVEYKLDGLVLLIEGKSIGSDGKVAFNALATVAYDDASHSYRFRAYNEGRYLDRELLVGENSFSWSFNAGPSSIVNTMHVTSKGEWSETSDVTFGGQPPRRSVEMLLQHVS